MKIPRDSSGHAFSLYWICYQDSRNIESESVSEIEQETLVHH